MVCSAGPLDCVLLSDDREPGYVPCMKGKGKDGKAREELNGRDCGAKHGCEGMTILCWVAEPRKLSWSILLRGRDEDIGCILFVVAMVGIR